ncbi:MAG: hypothetical protein IKN65_05350 [Clostridia bacterium]|nr:hypothetical protein [Clostridia bacterium]
MLKISNEALGGEYPLCNNSICVETDEFPEGFGVTDKTYKQIKSLADKCHARKINSPISFHNTRNKRERSIIVSFKNADDKARFINEINLISN